MANKPNTKAPPPSEDEEEGEGEAAEAAAAPAKKGLVGKILGPALGILRFANPLVLLKLPRKLQLIAAGGLLLVLGGGGAGLYYFVLSAPAEDPAVAEAASVKTEQDKLPAAEAAFMDIPDIIVNIQTPDSTPAYLKLSVSLELDKIEEKATIEPVMPRIIDQFQGYLRELRVEDIRGSAGVMRLKEELLRRVNLAAAPTPVRDVLLKEMIVQ